MTDAEKWRRISRREEPKVMNPRHAAALALVGWYLLVPPLHAPQAPLSRWRMYKGFDTVSACQQEIAAEQEWAKSGSKEGKVLTYEQGGVKEFFDGSKGQCIATDDPRLMEK